MKYLNILTACAGLAIAVPTLNPRQSEIDEDQIQGGVQESASRQIEIDVINKTCKQRRLDKNTCEDYKSLCQEAGRKELRQLQHCLRNIRRFCVDDNQCGHGFQCIKTAFEDTEPGTCYIKQEPTQDNKQDSTSPAKEPTQDNKQDLTSPAKDQIQAGEQDLASQQTKIDKTDKICQTRQFTKAQCVSFQFYCKEGRGIVELDQLNHCVEVLGAPCKDDDQCGHGFQCYKEAGVCDTKRSQAGEQESASPAKEPTQDTPTNITTPTKDQIQAGEQESASAAKEPTQAGEQEPASPTKELTQDTTKNIATPTTEPTQAGEQESASPEINETDKICKTRGLETGKQESASPANKPTQAGEQESASTTKEPTQAGEQESASSEQTQDKKQDSTSPAKEPTQDTTTNVATPTKEPTQDTTTNVTTPSRPCTKEPINSSEKNPVVGAKSTQA
ncbi:hypothetical protein MHUMG1_03509 [Metarhizium humberi]|uniref:Cell wall protein n=1 Tax=Metarhizium humberi TaxID=2596975 RepID=A0A9P8MCI1_9HYPO|nr:hypothetical protein MHUMG1_03509 [Metarhizium humberi]